MTKLLTNHTAERYACYWKVCPKGRLQFSVWTQIGYWTLMDSDLTCSEIHTVLTTSCLFHMSSKILDFRCWIDENAKGEPFKHITNLEIVHLEYSALCQQEYTKYCCNHYSACERKSLCECSKGTTLIPIADSFKSWSIEWFLMNEYSLSHLSSDEIERKTCTTCKTQNCLLCLKHCC